jgi:excisionase family DNA binding protein
VPTTATPRLLTVPETAERLRVSRWTVYRRIADGQIPARRLNDGVGPLRVYEHELQEWIDAEPSVPSRLVREEDGSPPERHGPVSEPAVEPWQPAGVEEARS